MIGNIEKEIEKAKTQLMIVEGIKDKKALEELGFKHIFVINEHNKSIQERIETIPTTRTVCILTDFDKQGKKLFNMLNSELSQMSIKINNSFHFFLMKNKLSHIEGLATFIENANQ